MPVLIDLEHDLQPVSQFRANASAVIAEVQEHGRPVVLTQHGRGAAVLLDIRTYQSLLEENETLRAVLNGLEDRDAGRLIGQDAAVERLQGRLR